MKKLVLYGGLIVVAILGIMAYNYALNASGGGSGMSATPTPAPWPPASLYIPSLHIDAPVINVGATSEGAMDAPTSKAIHSMYWTSVFWYDLGAAPGQAGEAGIAGHLRSVGGGPAVFWLLQRMAPAGPDSLAASPGKNAP